jgi:hypothetical protein
MTVIKMFLGEKEERKIKRTKRAKDGTLVGGARIHSFVLIGQFHQSSVQVHQGSYTPLGNTGASSTIAFITTYIRSVKRSSQTVKFLSPEP